MWSRHFLILRLTNVLKGTIRGRLLRYILLDGLFLSRWRLLQDTVHTSTRIRRSHHV